MDFANYRTPNIALFEMFSKSVSDANYLLFGTCLLFYYSGSLHNLAGGIPTDFDSTLLYYAICDVVASKKKML
jgi:hypothetical protein